VFLQAGQEAGLPFNPDLNGPSSEGVGFYQITTRNGFRLSASRAYLWRALARRNLVVRTRALATRVLFEGKRAVGVAYRYGNKTIEVRAGREVILCGGAINSPQVLQLSGVGPVELLKSQGIDIVHDSPAVGAICRTISATTTSIARGARASTTISIPGGARRSRVCAMC